MRRCFDALRRQSAPAEWIEAFMLDHPRPSPSRISDALSNEVKWNDAISWHSDLPPDELRLRRTADHALRIARGHFASPDYFDGRCGTFTPGQLRQPDADGGLRRTAALSPPQDDR